MRYRHFIFFISLFLFLSSNRAQSVYFVKYNASGNADGSSWENAFLRLQQALAIAQDGDQIWVAKGAYRPTTTTDRFAFFNLPTGVALYGGFSGTETELAQRNWNINLTVLSGDIGVPGDSTDNSYNVMYTYSPSDKTRLDGFIVEEGNATNTDNSIDYQRPTRSGGGLYVDGEGFGYAQMRIENCTFRHNRALFQGGGVYVNGLNGGVATAQVDHCVFEHNYSQTYGGGLAVENLYEQPFGVSVAHSTFNENQATSSGSAIWFQYHQSVQVTDCIFTRNRGTGYTLHFKANEVQRNIDISGSTFESNADMGGTMIFTMYSLDVYGLKARLSDCRIAKNSGTSIGAICFGGVMEFDIRNSIFDRNSNGTSAESVMTWEPGEAASHVIFTNCLLYKNEGYEIHAFGANGGPIYMYNTVILEDEGPTKGFFQTNVASTPLYLQNCLVNVPSCASLGSFVHCEGGNLFDIDPMFVDTSAGNFHLQSCSPLINAGTNAIVDSLGLFTDFENHTRIQNGIADIGAYESFISLHPSVTAHPACAGSSNGAVEISPDICPPYTFSWSNGVTTGTNTEGLTAGTYIFTAIGTNNIPVSDTVQITEPTAVLVYTQAHDATCYNEANGWVETNAEGGTPPYTYHWSNNLDSVPNLSGLPHGVYTVIATDANGCTGQAQAIIGSPAEIIYYLTVQDASCMGCVDGSILFDSVTGGVNPPLPADMLHLPAGHYCVTLTDGIGCTVIVCADVKVASDTENPEFTQLSQIQPNPTPFGGEAVLTWTDAEAATLRITDPSGRVLDMQQLPSASGIRLQALWPPGIYLVELRTGSGARAVRRWIIF